jgi:uncharacterized membrane protein
MAFWQGGSWWSFTCAWRIGNFATIFAGRRDFGAHYRRKQNVDNFVAALLIVAEMLRF